METSVRQGVTSARVTRETGRRGILLTVLVVLLALGHSAWAQEKEAKDAQQPAAGQAASAAKEGNKDANEADESWWKKWDASVKDPNNPNELLSVKWGSVLKVLQAKELEQKTREQVLDRIVSPIFDFPLMGQLALGRTHWPKLNAAQREKFIQLFVTRLKALYLEKTIFYTDQKITLKPGVQKKNLIQIPMVVLSEGKEISILYKLRKGDGQGKSKAAFPWRIYDVEIEGVSILLTYRSQFDDILRQGTVQDLLSQLEKTPTK